MKKLIIKINSKFKQLKLLTALCIFIVSLLVGLNIVARFDHAAQETETAHITQVATIYASAIDKVIRHVLSATHTLAVLVHQGKGKVPEYPSLAQYMLPMYKGAYALSLAPDGVMRQIEPELPNLAVKNHDLFEFKDREQEVKNIQEGLLIFQGPFQLLQGPQGGVGVLPVFLKNPQGEKYFWGYTLVTIKFPEVFEDVGLQDLEKQGYLFELSGINEFTHQKEVILASKQPLTTNVVRIPIKLYGAEWELAVAKVMPWQHGYRSLFAKILTLMSAILMAWLSFAILKKFEENSTFKEIAMFDPLTHLLNRRSLHEKLNTILKIADEKNFDVVLCYLDLDGFKKINDDLGHMVGDELLQYVAEQLKDCLRQNDIIARVGGDEFVIVFSHIRSIHEDITPLIERIVDTISQPIHLSEHTVNISTSLGASIYRQDATDIDQLLLLADQAMYSAKKSGKNRYCFAQNNANSSQ